MAPPQRDPRDRFDESYIPEPNSGCWLWIGKISTKGYPVFHSRSNIEMYAHRFSLQMATQEEGVGLAGCHRCDNPPCVNPDHLFWGTWGDNIRDASRKGRAKNSHGSKTHCPQGHPYDEVNTYWHLYRGKWCRSCRQCSVDRTRVWRSLRRKPEKATP